MLHKLEEKRKERDEEVRRKGLFKEEREDILDVRQDKAKLLNSNISKTREHWAAQMPSAIEELNEVIKHPKNKLYLR